MGEIKEAIDDFCTFLVEEKGAAPNTISAYKNDLRKLTDFILRSRSGTDKLSSIDHSTIQSFIANLKRRGYKETSIARKIASIRSFFSHLLYDEGRITVNPAEGISSPGTIKTIPKIMSPSEVDVLLEQAAQRSTPEGMRDRAMLELLYASGMRVTELVFLDEGNINLDPLKPSVRCVGRGLKERTIPIHERALKAIADYLKIGRPLLVHDRNELALFVNRRGERLTRQGFWLILKGYAQSADLVGISPHTPRHSFAAHMLHGGMPLRNVK